MTLRVCVCVYSRRVCVVGIHVWDLVEVLTIQWWEEEKQDE